MRPVEAQEEVGVPAVQEEVCCSEGDGEALDGVAEVGGDPEVRGKGIHKDVLGVEGQTGQKVRAEPRLAAMKVHIPGEPLGGQTLEEKNLPLSHHTLTITKAQEVPPLPQGQPKLCPDTLNGQSMKIPQQCLSL